MYLELLYLETQCVFPVWESVWYAVIPVLPLQLVATGQCLWQMEAWPPSRAYSYSWLLTWLHPAFKSLGSTLPALIISRYRCDARQAFLCFQVVWVTLGVTFPSQQPLCFQIDPSVLQQTLQQGNLLAPQPTSEPGLAPQHSSLQTPDSTVPASVVLQPISGLSLQTTVTSANLTIGPLSEQDSVLTTSSSGESCRFSWVWQLEFRLAADSHRFGLGTLGCCFFPLYKA